MISYTVRNTEEREFPHIVTYLVMLTEDSLTSKKNEERIKTIEPLDIPENPILTWIIVL